MRPLLGFVKSTLIGGVLFLLPVGLVVVVLAKLVVYARRAGDALHARLFPGADSDLVPLVFAALLLLGIAFAAGVLVRSAAGARLQGRLERVLLGRVPAYALLRQAVADMAGSADVLAAQPDTRVVIVRLDDCAQFGVVIERGAEGCTVYLPGAPSAMSGSVIIVAHDRIEETELAATDLAQGMRRFGRGLARPAPGGG